MGRDNGYPSGQTVDKDIEKASYRHAENKSEDKQNHF
jgi:hypothetical protein